MDFIQFNQQASKVGIGTNTSERLALRVLHQIGSMSLSELGKATTLSRAAVTSLADRLERTGLATRKPHETDRRRIDFSLTRRGTEQVEMVLSGATAE